MHEELEVKPPPLQFISYLSYHLSHGRHVSLHIQHHFYRFQASHMLLKAEHSNLTHSKSHENMHACVWNCAVWTHTHTHRALMCLSSTLSCPFFPLVNFEMKSHFSFIEHMISQSWGQRLSDCTESQTQRQVRGTKLQDLILVLRGRMSQSYNDI